jgi:hypothetical protein
MGRGVKQGSLLMKQTKRRSSERYAAALRANVDAWFADEISDEEFDREQRRLWDEIGNGRMGAIVAAKVCPLRGAVL